MITNLIEEKSEIQSVLLDKDKFDKEKAKEFLKRNKFKSSKLDVTDKYYRYRQHEPNKYNSFATKNIKPGVKFVIGFLNSGD